MACKNCTETSYPKSSYYSAYQGCTQLNSCSTSCKDVIDSACVVYTGPKFVNIQLDSNICVETVLSTIDGMLSAVTGDYSSYNTDCLGTQTTQQQFVETISAFVCETRENLDLFVGTTFPLAVTNLQTQISGIINPNLTSCASLGIVSTDTYSQVQGKFITGICDIYSKINLSTANWNSCFTIVGTPPTTPLEATNALIGQICSIKNATSTSLPTFNNIGTCIPIPTATDTLVYTVTAMRDLLCTKPGLNINNLTFGCVSKPSDDSLDLQGTLQSVLTNLSNVNINLPSFNPSQFTSAPVDPLNLCKGYVVSLSSALTPTDRLVAVNNADTTPGTLVDKLTEGANINLDTTTTPGTMIISVDPVGLVSDGKVKASAADPTADYLDIKTKGVGDTNGLTLTTFYDNTDQKLAIQGDIDVEVLVQKLIEVLSTNTELKTAFCALIATCPVSCTPPTNVTVTQQT